MSLRLLPPICCWKMDCEIWDEPPPLEQLIAAIVIGDGDSLPPVGMRMRAAYYLRQAYLNNKQEGDNENTADDDYKNGPRSGSKTDTGQTVVSTLLHGLQDRRHGSLLRHEFAYVLGQLRDPQACAVLEQVLEGGQNDGKEYNDDVDCVMVRHEAAEALGAIGQERSISVLKRVMDQTRLPELSDTCRLSLNMIEYYSKSNDRSAPMGCACMMNPYNSVDPSPPDRAHADMNIQDIGQILASSDSYSILDRYRALFSLRNIAGNRKDADAAVQILCNALVSDTSSALLRHEICYVLGQLQNIASVPALVESLQRVNEHKMVRHEAAEALGAMMEDPSQSDTVEAVLRSFLDDPVPEVRESCIVALDAADYWDQFAKSKERDEHDDNGEQVEPSQDTNADAGGATTFKQHKSSLLNHRFNILS
jgi:deoxyhypusine monooxygenase